MSDDTRRAALGGFVAERRGRRSVRSLAGRARLDVRTWGRVEAGQRVQQTRYDMLDDAMGWPVGASRAFLAGQTEHPASYVAPARDADEPALLERLAELTAEMASLVAQLRRLRER